ncbi:MAG: sulfocyanin-like copper-binding protein [Chthoniobacter sp.]
MLLLSAPAQEPATPHDPAAHAGAGLNKALTAGITEADFLKLGAEPKTVKVTLIAAYTDENYGMNFDGFSHGKAVFTIPTGWKVEVTFINPARFRTASLLWIVTSCENSNWAIRPLPAPPRQIGHGHERLESDLHLHRGRGWRLRLRLRLPLARRWRPLGGLEGRHRSESTHAPARRRSREGREGREVAQSNYKIEGRQDPGEIGGVRRRGRWLAMRKSAA